MSKSMRRTVARLSLSVLLFLQLVASAYACAMTTPAKMNMPSAGAVPAYESCERSDQPPSKLCERHCLQSSQSVDTQPYSAPVSPMLPLIGVVARRDLLLPTQRDRHHARRATVVDPPPLVRFGVLRI
jgi:hypothetical protein